MALEIEKIFLSNEFHKDSKIDEENTFTDVIVYLKSGEKYVASFFTFKNIETQKMELMETGACLGGTYFWEKNMLLVDNCSLQKIENVILDLAKEGDFFSAFRKI